MIKERAEILRQISLTNKGKKNEESKISKETSSKFVLESM